jgi:hypothetical protein
VIYYARTPTGSIKIGCTDDVEERLRDLESYYGAPLVLLARMPGNREVEAAIHARFAPYRIGRTEQFQPAPDLMEWIEDLAEAIGRASRVATDWDAVGAVEPMTPAVRLACSPEWKDWVERLADHCRLDVAKVIDRALIDYARKEGFDEEAPSR